MVKLLLAVSSFLAVQSATEWKVHPTILWDSASDKLPGFGTTREPTEVTVCTVTDDWANGHGGEGDVYAPASTMNVVAVVAEPAVGHEACGTALMVRATKSNNVALDTQYLYVKIAGTTTAALSTAANGDILLPDLSDNGKVVIKGKVTDYLCGATCVDPEFDLKATALPEGLGYYVGAMTDTDCTEPGTDHPDWTFVSATGLQTLPSFVDSQLDDLSKACNQYYELHSTATGVFIEVQVTQTMPNGPAGPWAFRLQDEQMKALCGSTAAAEHTNRVPFQCMITSKAAEGPPPTTTTTTTLAVDTTSTTVKTEPETESTTTTTATTASKTEEESSAFQVAAAAIAAALCVL